MAAEPVGDPTTRQWWSWMTVEILWADPRVGKYPVFKAGGFT